MLFGAAGVPEESLPSLLWVLIAMAKESLVIYYSKQIVSQSASISSGSRAFASRCWSSNCWNENIKIQYYLFILIGRNEDASVTHYCPSLEPDKKSRVVVPNSLLGALYLTTRYKADYSNII